MANNFYSNSKTDRIGNCPSNWRIRQLKRVGRLLYGDNLPEDSRISGDIKVYGSNGIVGYHNVPLTNGETIIVGRKGTAGAVNFSDESCFPIDTSYYIDEDSSYCYLKWLYYVLQTLDLENLETESPVPGLNRGLTEQKYICVPKFDEQKAIADYLGKACTKIDIVIKKKEQQLDKLNQYFFTKVDELLTSKNYEDNGQSIDLEDGFIQRTIPLSWKVDRLRDVAIINNQSLGTSTPDDYKIKYLDISNVNKYGVVEKDEIEELLFEEAPSRAKRVVKKFDTVISSVRTNLQAVAYIDFDASDLICSTGFFVCRPKFPSEIRNKFLYYFLLTTYSKDYFYSRSTGVSYPAINDYKFGSIPVFIPPVDKQDEIIDHLDQLKDMVESVSVKVRDQIETLTSYKKSLIYECVTGKKRVYKKEEQSMPSIYAE